MDRFLQSRGVWVRHVDISRNLDPKRRLGDECEEQLAGTPPKEPFLHRTCSVLTAICPKTYTMAEDSKENAVGGKKLCSAATRKVSGFIELVKEREQEAIKAKEELFQPATIPIDSIAWVIGPDERGQKQIASKHPWPKRSVTCSIEILSMTKFIEVMYDWKLGSSSNFLVTTRWHVCSYQLSKRTGLISIVHHIIFGAWPASCNCWCVGGGGARAGTGWSSYSQSWSSYSQSDNSTGHCTLAFLSAMAHLTIQGQVFSFEIESTKWVLLEISLNFWRCCFWLCCASFYFFCGIFIQRFASGRMRILEAKLWNMSLDLHALNDMCPKRAGHRTESYEKGRKKGKTSSFCRAFTLEIHVVISTGSMSQICCVVDSIGSTHSARNGFGYLRKKAGRRGKTGHQSGSILDWCHRCTSERWGQTLDKFPHEQSCLDSILQAILFIFSRLIKW